MTMLATDPAKFVRRPPPDPRVDFHLLARRRSRETLVIAALAAALVVVFMLSIGLGSVWIPLNEIFAALTGGAVRRSSFVVIQNVRLPRSLTALLSGSALGMAGLQ